MSQSSSNCSLHLFCIFDLRGAVEAEEKFFLFLHYASWCHVTYNDQGLGFLILCICSSSVGLHRSVHLMRDLLGY